MKAAAKITATESIALAKTKATSDIQKEQDLDLSSSLRIFNLEKLLKWQEQQTNELYNRMKIKKTWLEVIIQSLWPLQNNRLLKKRNKNKHTLKIVELTKDNAEGLNEIQHHLQSNQYQNSNPFHHTPTYAEHCT